MYLLEGLSINESLGAHAENGDVEKVRACVAQGANVINEEKDEKANKRQSFISDFAALEKTYKILGLSIPTEQAARSEEPKQVKKRHNSEGKVKNKDKNKVKRKSVVQPTEQNKPEDPVSPPAQQQPEIETKLNALDKVDK